MLAPRLAVLAALIAGCGGKKREAPPRAQPDAGVVGPVIRDLAPPADRLPEPALPNPHLVRETLLEAGAAPRKVRRYRLAEDRRELAATMTVTTSGFRDGAWSAPAALATITDGFGVTVADGDTAIALRGLIAAVGGGDDAARRGAEAYLARWRALVERRRVAIAVDDRGRAGAITLTDDPAGTGAGATDTRDEVVQRWLGLAVPLPAEAIGVGARWRVVTILRSGGAAVKQTATYRLIAVDGDAWTIEVELERLGERQPIAVPGAPRGVTAELIGLHRVVKGSVTVDAGSPLPRSGELTSEARAHARFTAPGRPAVDEVSDDVATIVLASK